MSNTNDDYRLDEITTEKEMEDFLRQGEIFLATMAKESGMETSQPDELFSGDKGKSFYQGMFSGLASARGAVMAEVGRQRAANKGGEPDPSLLMQEINLVAAMCSVAKLCLKRKSQVLVMSKSSDDIN